MYDIHRVEARWRQTWREAGCFIAPKRPARPKFFNYDSGPFPNGPLHMGHVRTYVLGDMTARFQRLLGKDVLYATEFDAFGLPNELAALEAGIPPREYTESNIRLMTGQLKRLGVSYDWERIPSTCDPAYYRWTQWLFLWLFDRGWIEREQVELDGCPQCRTTLARMQIVDDRCWRCSSPVNKRSLKQWMVKTSRLTRILDDGLDALTEWSGRSKGLLHGFSGSKGDWCISRQRSWGTPIPIVFCSSCGTVPVRNLPVLLPDDLDWGQGANALRSSRSFIETRCPRCDRPARREVDTLDCFFDDIWCFLACLTPLSGFAFRKDDFGSWMPLDRFHSGLDTFVYLHLHRVLGHLLHAEGILDDSEPIKSYLGHDMVLAQGRKMSKHLGNAVSPDALLEKHGADALRLAVLWAAGPRRPINWTGDLLQHAEAFIHKMHHLYCMCGKEPLSEDGASRAVLSLQEQTRGALSEVRSFLEDYRPNAAIEKLALHQHRIEKYALHRIESNRMLPGDARILKILLDDFAVALSPLAPHLAEALREILGVPPFTCRAMWPSQSGSRGINP